MVFNQKEYKKKWAKENIEKLRICNRKWKEKNKDKIKEYYQKNKEYIKQKSREYYYKNQEKAKQYRKEWSQRPEVKQHLREYAKQPERRALERKYTKHRRLTDKKYATIKRLRNVVRRAFQHYSTTGKILISSKYGINYKAIIEHLKPFPKNLPNYEIHHIKPLHTFNLNNQEEIKKAFAPENHMWLTIEEHKEVSNLWH